MSTKTRRFIVTDSDDLMRVGEGLAALRSGTGMTTEQFAVHCGLASSSVRDIEKGRTIPRLSTFDALCRGLGAHYRIEVEMPE